MVHFVTEIDFEGDESSDRPAQNYQQLISSAVQNAVETISLRSIQNARVEKVVVEELRDEL